MGIARKSTKAIFLVLSLVYPNMMTLNKHGQVPHSRNDGLTSAQGLSTVGKSHASILQAADGFPWLSTNFFIPKTTVVIWSVRGLVPIITGKLSCFSPCLKSFLVTETSLRWPVLQSRMGRCNTQVRSNFRLEVQSKSWMVRGRVEHTRLRLVYAKFHFFRFFVLNFCTLIYLIRAWIDSFWFAVRLFVLMFLWSWTSSLCEYIIWFCRKTLGIQLIQGRSIWDAPVASLHFFTFPIDRGAR